MLASVVMRAILFLALASLLGAKPLEIFFIDVEGGQSTLIVSPSGQSLLIDAGYTDFSGRDADRIDDAARAAHIKRIDYVLITHHHSDHEGGVPNLLERREVGMFFDPGPGVDPSPEQVRTFQAYQEAMAKQHRTVIKAGDTIPVKGISVTVVVAAGAHFARGGEANPFCAGIVPEQNEVAENARSAGVIVEYGKFRFADFGDLTPNKETALLCPENRAGKIDLFLTDHHGGATSRAIYAMAPRVAVMNNGARKGDDPQGWKTVKASPGLQDLWQLHYALGKGEEANVADPFIANLEERCTGNPLKVTAEATGAFTIYNPRNKFSKNYPAR